MDTSGARGGHTPGDQGLGKLGGHGGCGRQGGHGDPKNISKRRSVLVSNILVYLHVRNSEC